MHRMRIPAHPCVYMHMCMLLLLLLLLLLCAILGCSLDLARIGLM